MNLVEMAKLLRLSHLEIERIQSYIEKVEKSEVRFCEDHDREYYDFEFQGQCPVCYEETLWWKNEHHSDEEAHQVLEKSGRVNSGDLEE
jgi:hypothetical protein